MDLDKILHFVPTHIEQIIAVLGALFLVTTILLLVRSLKEQPEQANDGLDVRSIEGALKRVLAQNPPTVVEKVSEGSAITADLAPLKNALAEKESQLARLNAELTEAKAAAAAAAAVSGGEAGGDAGSATAVASLEMEISDLKARLAEYEIIEDDIADLALYKEENARLKKEIEEARVTGASAAAAPPPMVEANPAAGIPGLTEALQEEAAAKPAAKPVTAAAPAPAPVAQSDVEEDFDPLAELLANAPEVTLGEESETPEGLLAVTEEADVIPADPLGSLDTEKMLAEAEGLAESAPADDDAEINALSDLLDTDKLLEEVNSLDAQDVMSEFKDKTKLG